MGSIKDGISFYYVLLLGDAYQKNWDEKPKSGGFCPGLANYSGDHMIIMYVYIYIVILE